MAGPGLPRRAGFSLLPPDSAVPVRMETTSGECFTGRAEATGNLCGRWIAVGTGFGRYFLIYVLSSFALRHA